MGVGRSGAGIPAVGSVVSADGRSGAGACDTE